MALRRAGWTWFDLGRWDVKVWYLTLIMLIDYGILPSPLSPSLAPMVAFACSLEYCVPVPSFLLCNLLNPSATFFAASSARVSASLMPTVSSFPNSHDSLSMRVRDSMSSAART